MLRGMSASTYKKRKEKAEVTFFMRAEAIKELMRWNDITIPSGLSICYGEKKGKCERLSSEICLTPW